MGDRRRVVALLGLLGVSAAWAAYVRWPVGTADTQAGGGLVAQRLNLPEASMTAPDVHTDVLTAERPRPGNAGRDLFRFKPKYVPPPLPPVRPAPAPVVASGPPPPPAIPPIPLKFIGVLEAAAGQRIAILSDGRGAPLYAKEGEALLGQYRILRVGAEAIEIEYIDGRGRQAIRLSGS